MEKRTSNYINTVSKDYALYVCESRAIPKAADGLKSAQRKALYLMMTVTGEIKTVSLSGLMISKNLYVHGDTSASDTISLLAAPYSNNLPWLQGIGTFGTRVNPKAFAAPRYTYVKRTKHAEDILYVDRDVVPMQENYDGSTQEPMHFLPLIPAVLLNGVSGIAVGWSTEILPRSLSDLIKATVSAIDGKKFKAPEPNFEYLNCAVKKLDGNSWEFSGKVRIDDASTATVTELPPDLSLEKFKEKLIALEDQNIIQTFTDHSSDQIEVEVKFKRGDLKNRNEAWIIKTLKLTTRKTERIVTVDWDNKSIRQFESAEELIKEFVEYRLQFYVKRYEKFVKDDSYELEFWKAFKQCFDGGLPAYLPKAANKEMVSKKIVELTKTCTLDDSQVDKIASSPSYYWAKDRYKMVQDKIKELESKIADHKRLLADPAAIRAVFRQEVFDLKTKKIQVER